MKLRIIRKERKQIVIKLDDKIKRINNEEFKAILREVLLEEQGKECNICHIDIPEVLLIHHKDGDHNNDHLDNLQILCFNCHFLIHQKPKALEKMGDWKGRPLDIELLRKIKEFEKQGIVIDAKFCIFHEDRKSEIKIGFDLETGKPLLPDKFFGVCLDCWGSILDKTKY